MTRARPEIRARFRAVVERAIAKADREQVEHLDRLRGRPERRRTWRALNIGGKGRPGRAQERDRGAGGMQVAPPSASGARSAVYRAPGKAGGAG